MVEKLLNKLLLLVLTLIKKIDYKKVIKLLWTKIYKSLLKKVKESKNELDNVVLEFLNDLITGIYQELP